MHNFWLQEHLDDFDATLDPGIEGDINWDTDALAENIPMLNDLNTYKDEDQICKRHKIFRYLGSVPGRVRWNRITGLHQ